MLWQRRMQQLTDRSLPVLRYTRRFPMRNTSAKSATTFSTSTVGRPRSWSVCTRFARSVCTRCSCARSGRGASAVPCAATARRYRTTGSRTCLTTPGSRGASLCTSTWTPCLRMLCRLTGLRCTRRSWRSGARRTRPWLVTRRRPPRRCPP